LISLLLVNVDVNERQVSAAGSRVGPQGRTEPGGPDGRGEAARLAQTLRLAVARMARRLRQTHAVGDVTLSGASVLARLNREGPDSPGSLAEQERVRPQAMAATLSALEERGLVKRTQDAADGRRSVMSVTEKGRQVVDDRASESVQRITAVLDEEFSPAERRMLGAVMPLLERLAERL
jgi:DNA-binding MarR family transcriptional regulator